VGLPPWPDVVDVLAELNATLRAVAAAHDAVVADIHGRFLGHGLRAGNPGQHDARPTDRGFGTATSSSPTPGGADGARCLLGGAAGARRAGGSVIVRPAAARV
jgi:hypothetical protein